MSTSIDQTAARITADDIASVAQAGIDRALAARAQASELTSDEIAAVGGGALTGLNLLTKPALQLNPGILAGPYPIQPATTIGSLSVTRY